MGGGAGVAAGHGDGIGQTAAAGAEHGAQRAGFGGHGQAQAAQAVGVGAFAKSDERLPGRGAGGQGRGQRVLQGGQALFGFGCGVQRMAGGFGQAARPGREQRAGGFGIGPGGGHRLLGARAASDGQPHAALIVLGRQDLDEPHLAGAPQMGAAAGAQVGPARVDQAHRAVQLLFAAVGKARQLARFRVPRAHRGIGAHGGVGRGFGFGQLGGGQRPVHVHAHGGLADVEADVFGPEQPVQRAGQNMLAGVLLHVVAPPRPVELALNTAAHGQRRVQRVPDNAAACVHAGDGRAAQRAGVTGLAAAFGVKGGAVQRRAPAAGHGLARKHRGGEPAGKGVRLVEFFCRLHGQPPPLAWHSNRSIIAQNRGRQNR